MVVCCTGDSHRLQYTPLCCVLCDVMVCIVVVMMSYAQRHPPPPLLPPPSTQCPLKMYHKTPSPSLVLLGLLVGEE